MSGKWHRLRAVDCCPASPNLPLEALAEYQRKMQLFNPPFVECLEQRGYSVR